jgi:hypothetical protein
VTVAAGTFAIGLVLGWAALFAAAGSWRGRLIRLGLALALVPWVALSPSPWLATAGLTAGALAHLLLLLGLREART